MEARFVAVVGRVSDHVLAVQFAADVADRIFQSALAHEAVLPAAGALSHQLHGIVNEDVLDIPENFLEQRQELGTAAALAESLRDARGCGGNVRRQRALSRGGRHRIRTRRLLRLARQYLYES